jgi:uncharacterized glyoxalase superfamily protein PhnB
MDKRYKPENYNSVSAYFVVEGAQKFVDFLKQLFNATERRRYDMPDGTIMHIELQIDDTIIMIGDASEEFLANNHLMHAYVPDVDSTFEKALELGCEAIERPRETNGDPDRRGTFKDMAGNIWSVATQL